MFRPPVVMTTLTVVLTVTSVTFPGSLASRRTVWKFHGP